MDMPDNHTITGHQVVENWVKRQYYYVISFDKPYVVREVLSSAGGEKAKRLILDFDLAEGDTLQVKIALSSVCLEGGVSERESGMGLRQDSYGGLPAMEQFV